MHCCVFLLAIAAVPIWSKALNDIDACTNRKIYVLDLAIYATENNSPTCNVTTVSKWVTMERGCQDPHTFILCTWCCCRMSRSILEMAFPTSQIIQVLQLQRACRMLWPSIRAPGTSCRPSTPADMSPRTWRPQMSSMCMTTATTCSGWPRCAHDVQLPQNLCCCCGC